MTVRDEYDAQTQQYRLHVSQKTAPTADQPEKLPLHIPLDIELYDSEGNVIPLQKGGLPVNNVLNVTEAEQTFVFDGVAHKPVPSLLREFSAPVKLDYPYSDQQLTFLMQHARNEFARWDAAQSLLATYIKLNVARHQQKQPLSLPLHVADAFRAVLLDEKLDPALAAQILTLPSENEIAELFATIDPEAIAAVHEAIVRCRRVSWPMNGWRCITPTRPTATVWSTPRSPSAPCAMFAGYGVRRRCGAGGSAGERTVSPGG